MSNLKQTFGYFWYYLRRFKLQIVVVLLASIASTYFAVQSPQFLGQAIQELINYLTSGATGDKSAFYNIVRLMLLFALGTAITAGIKGIVMSGVSGKVTGKMRIDLFEKLEKLSIRFFDTHSDGDILSRFSSDLDNVSNTLNQSLHQIIGDTLQLFVTLIMMFTINVELTLVVLSTLPIVLISTVIILQKSQKYIGIQQKELGYLNGFADERFTGQQLIIANGLSEEVEAEFDIHNEKVYNATYKGQLYGNILFPFLQGMSLISAAIVIFSGAWLTLNGHFALTEAVALLVMFQQYTMMFYMPMTRVASQFSQIQLALTGASRVQELLDEQNETERQNAQPITSIVGDVHIDNVNFSYGEKTILKNINIMAQAGQTIALVGHTGSGKTTIINLLNRFYNVEDGAIRFDGRDIRDITLQTLREHVGIVLQDSVIFSGTIRDNIMFGKRDATQADVEAAARLANIHDFIEHLADGYDTMVSEENNHFSVGQKQLLSIARTIITDPNILILDEATSNVDTVTEAHLQEAMDNVIAGRTSFVIAHRLKTILKADKIIVLRQGEIIETGTHAELLEQNGHYAELYKNQFSF